MTEKRLARELRTGRIDEPQSESEPEFARGSTSRVTAEQLMQISQPRTPSRAPMSVFQVAPQHAPSEPEEMIVPAAGPSSDRPYLIVVIALLFGMVAVLGLLLLL
jgi:hypothetical protein